jgi:putative transposase
MSPAPSTYYYRARAKPAEAVAAEARLIARIHEICAEFPRYGYRRVTAQLKAEGERVNRKRVARIMREQDLRVRPKRRFVATTDGDHDGPVFPDLVKDLAPTGPDQLWVADLTYIRVLSGFVYLAVILDARSRRVVGWALSRRIDADLAVAASEAAAAARRPPRRAASTTPVAARRTRPSRTARSSRSTSFVVRWAGAATRTITPRRRAS